MIREKKQDGKQEYRKTGNIKESGDDYITRDFFYHKRIGLVHKLYFQSNAFLCTM